MLAAALFVLAAAPAAAPDARATLLRLCASSDAPLEDSLAACRDALKHAVPAGTSLALRASLARRLASAARWDEVVEIHRALAAERPLEAEWPTRLGAALLYGAGRPGEAEAALREALARAPESVEAWALLGGALAARQRYPEAVAALERAGALDPEYLELRPALREVLAAARRGESWP